MRQPAEMTTELKQAASEDLAAKIGELCNGEVNEIAWVALMAVLAQLISTAPSPARHMFFMETVTNLSDMVNVIS